MPHLSYDEATLDEILFVRNGPLKEVEVWAILKESCDTFNRIYKKTSFEKLNHLISTFVPDSLLLSLDGSIKFSIPKNGGHAEKRYLPKEYGNVYSSAGHKSSLEQVFIYALGMILWSGLENGLPNSVQVSIGDSLESILSRMLKEHARSRIVLAELIKILEYEVNTADCKLVICSLAEEVIGPYGLKPLDDPHVIKALYEDSTHSIIDNEPRSSNRNITANAFHSNHVEPVRSLSPVSNDSGRIMSIREFDEMAHEKQVENVKQVSPPMRKSLCPRPLPFTNNLSSKDSIPQSSGKTSASPQQYGKAWSPSGSNPDFQGLVGLEARKLEDAGFTRNPPKMIESKKSYKSMPSLLNIEEDDTVESNDRTAETPFRKAESMHDMNSNPSTIGKRLQKGSALSMTTSSQISLMHGAYRLDSPDEVDGKLNRYLSFSSQISNNSDQSDIVPYPYYNRTSDMKDPGPEFMKIQNNRNSEYIDVSPPYFGGALKTLRTLYVILPNTQKVKTSIENSVKVRELFFQIALHLGVKETLYFGLALFQENEYIFLDIDAKLSKYAPAGWKDDNFKKRKEDYILHFKVKFFIDEPSNLKQRTTIHVYYIQLRQDLLNNTIHCPIDKAIELAGYALVAEYGPYCYEFDGKEYFNIYHYLPEKLFRSIAPGKAMQQVVSLHQQYSNISPDDAELQFLCLAKTLSEYGLYFYQVSRSKKLGEDKFWLGVCVRGIVLLEPKEHLKAVVHKQAWHLLKEFDFDKKKFIIKSAEYPKMVFYTPHYQRSKYLFNICRSFHRFQLYSPNLQQVQQESSKSTKQPKPSVIKKLSLKSQKEDNIQPNIQVVQNKASSKRRDQDIVHFVVSKAPSEGLGITIVGGESSHKLLQGIYIKTIHEDGILGNEQRLSVGDQILSVNGKSLENISHDEAVKILKTKSSKVDLVIQKHQMTDILKNFSMFPPVNPSQLERDDNTTWQTNVPVNQQTVLKELEGIEKLKTEVTDDEFSERCIDDFTPASPSEFDSHSLHEEQDKAELKPHKIVNNVVVDDDTDSYISNEDEQLPPPSIVQPHFSNLKRFQGFDELNKIVSDDEQSKREDQAVSPLEPVKSVAKNTIESNDKKFLELSSATFDEGSSSDLFAVDLKKVDGSFGISIMGGTDSVLPHGGIYIQALQKNGPAFKTGVMQVGDHILSVNDASLENCTHAQAVEILKDASTNSKLVLLRNDVLYRSSSRQNHDQTNESEKSFVFEVDLQKGKSGLGLSLVGGADADLVYEGQFMIQKLFPGQALEKSKKFQIGDIILAINDQILEGLTKEETISIVRTLPDDVHIIAKRPHPQDIPNELYENSRPVSPEKILKDLKDREFLSGRGSREGNRIAKELIRSMSIDNDTTISETTYPLTDDSKQLSDEHLSPGFAHSSDDQSILPAMSEQSIMSDSGDSQTTLKNKTVPVTRTKSCDSDTTIGFPRHRPLPDSNVHTEHVEERKLASQQQLHGDVIFVEKKSIERLSSSIEQKHGNFFLKTGQNLTSSNFPQNYMQVKCINDIPLDGMSILEVKRIIEESADTVKVLVTPEESFSNHSSINEKPPTPDGNLHGKNKKALKLPEPISQLQSIDAIENSIEKNNTANLSSAPTSPRKARSMSPLKSVPNSPILKRLNAMSRSNSQESESKKTLKRNVISPQGELIFVQLEKSTKGLGMTLSTDESEKEKFVYIKDIAIGSAVHLDGNLCVGDRIVSVNGSNVEGMSQKEIVTMFRSAKGVVMMECYRPPQVLPSSPQLKLPSVPTSINIVKPAESTSIISEDVLPTDDAFDQRDIFDTSSPAQHAFEQPTYEISNHESSRQEEKESSRKNVGEGSVIPQNLIVPNNQGFDTSEGISFSDEPSFFDSDISHKNENESDNHGVNEYGRMINNLAIDKDEESIINDTQNDSDKNINKDTDVDSDDDEFGFSESIDFSLRDMDADGVIRSPSRITQPGVPVPDISNSQDETVLSEKFIEKTQLKNYTSYNVKRRLEKLSNEMGNIADEFLSLRQMKLSGTVDVANRAINRSKNRLKNVLPFDENRVKLTGGEESDYINASHIQIECEDLRSSFIVAQSPLQSTVEDFWRCIWEYKIEVIAMLVKCHEAGKEKCCNYWPKPESPIFIRDRLEVELIYEEEQSVLSFRQFQIRNKKLEKSLFVTQVCFHDWPDTGVPEVMVDFLNFVKFVRSFKKSSSPTLIHCSGGVGRSGVFVMVSTIWNAIEADRTFNVHSIAKALKTQRQQILQTKEQYTFVYEAAKTLLQDIIS